MNLRQLLNCVPVLSLLIGASLPTNADPVDPTIGEWKTFGNGPSHTGFYPTSIGSATDSMTMCTIRTTYGDFGVCDRITLQETAHSITVAGVVTLGEPETVRTIQGSCD